MRRGLVREKRKKHERKTERKNVGDKIHVRNTRTNSQANAAPKMRRRRDRARNAVSAVKRNKKKKKRNK